MPGNQMNDLGAEFDNEQREHQKPYKSARKHCHHKMPEVHFKYSCRKHKKLERRRRGKHGGEHDGPELMLVERSLDFGESLLRHSLAQECLSAKVTDPVQNAAADGGARRSQNRI